METTATEYSSLRKNSPMRSPDWRWRKATALVSADKRPDRFSDDKIVHAAYKFFKILDKIEDPWEYCSKCIHNQELAEAHEIYTQPEAKMLKWELEARLLARLNAKEISDITGLSKKTVKWYESLFYNVVDRLDNTSWILHFAIGKSVFFGASERDMDILWKLYGYLYGSTKLDWIIHHRADEDANRWAYKEISANMLRKNLQSSKIVAANSWNQLQMLQLHQKEQEISVAAASHDGHGDNKNVLGYFMEAMSSVITTGSRPNNNDGLRLISEDTNAAEPRAYEASMIANGDTSILDKLHETKLPEAKANGDI
jgi:hypothetical protein